MTHYFFTITAGIDDEAGLTILHIKISQKTVREVIQGFDLIMFWVFSFLFAQTSTIIVPYDGFIWCRFFGLVLQVLGAISIGLIHMIFCLWFMFATTMETKGELLTWDLFAQLP